MENYRPRGTKFYCSANKLSMILVDTTEPREDLHGWLVYQHADGQWVTLRKATDEDRCKIVRAISRAHHDDGGED